MGVMRGGGVARGGGGEGGAAAARMRQGNVVSKMFAFLLYFHLNLPLMRLWCMIAWKWEGEKKKGVLALRGCCLCLEKERLQEGWQLSLIHI